MRLYDTSSRLNHVANLALTTCDQNAENGHIRINFQLLLLVTSHPFWADVMLCDFSQQKALHGGVLDLAG